MSNTSSHDNNNSSLSNTSFRYRSSRWPGRLMILSGVSHTRYAFRVPDLRDPFIAAIRDGYVDQFKQSTARGNSFWFIFAGASMVLIGQLMNWYLFPEPRSALLKGRGAESKSKGAKPTNDSWKERLVGATHNQQASQFVLPRKMGVWLMALWIGGATAFPVSGFHLFGLQGLAILLTK
ncbi:hypothetical protein BGZ52_010722 [Haplosporangium bisporale]|nr:hypothetical protein BGZ52_010722 [Haplosporangium bisporale]KAI9233916.1 MAG: hypothetical protein BYD32DRAFT_424771 [Podila humilis]KFH66042.1 hypothetical protein MVEG_08143 [Podila verticillata NRRL 6337]